MVRHKLVLEGAVHRVGPQQGLMSIGKSKAKVYLEGDKLQASLGPLFYHDRQRFVNVMRHAVALNGAFFNTQRMMQQYVVKAYFL